MKVHIEQRKAISFENVPIGSWFRNHIGLVYLKLSEDTVYNLRIQQILTITEEYTPCNYLLRLDEITFQEI